MADDLEIATEEIQGKKTLLRIRGRLDAQNAARLMERIASLQVTGLDLILDLADVSFLGSSGIGALLALAQEFQGRGGSVRIGAASPPVASVIRLLNLDKFLPLDGAGTAHAMHPVVAKREYSLLALVELSQGLTLSRDIYAAAEILLLNVMGQLRPSGACLWLFAEGDRESVLIGTHGVRREDASALMAACAPRLLECSHSNGAPLSIEGLAGASDPRVADLASRAGLQLFAPIAAGEEKLGLLALGRHPDGEPYSDLDLELLRASIAIAAMSFQNGRFSGRLLERNRELRMANERLEELDRLKSEFLSNVNHELRTPLTTIMATLDLLASFGAGSSGAQLLEPAREQARKLFALIERVLSFSEAGEVSLTLDLVDGNVAALVEEYYRDRLPGVTSGLRELTLAPSAAALHARFDKRRLKEILDALVDNAVKFTPPGSVIGLGARPVTLDGRKWIQIDVTDNGPGMPAAELPSLFESFRQADGSSTRKVGGMGIGLSLAQRLAERIGGRLTATSAPGKGSTFSVLLTPAPP